MGLQQGAPRPSPRPARPATCCSSWKVRSAARGSPVREADIGVEHADEREAREMVALGDELRADDDVELRRPRRASSSRRRSIDATRSLDRTMLRARGNSVATSSAQPFDAGPAGDERVRRLAFGHASGGGIDVAAMMAEELAPEAVLDQPGGAVRAFEAMAAGAAQRERRIAAAVEEEERLLAARERVPTARRARREQRPRGGPSRLRSTPDRPAARPPKRSGSRAVRSVRARH